MNQQGDTNAVPVAALHPPAQDPSPPVTGSIPAFVARADGPTFADVVLRAPRSSSAGPSGWSFALTKLAWDLLEFRPVLEGLAKAVVSGSFVAQHGWLTASAIVPLRKRNGGIRPIAIGESWMRLAARWALGSVLPDSILGPSSYGVGTKGGCEAVIWSVADNIPHAGAGLVQIDFENAFNTLSRHATADALRSSPAANHLLGYFRSVYQHPSALLVSAADGSVRTLLSRTGGRQGDPMYPFLFSLTLCSLIQDLSSRFAKTVDQMALICAYLDDITLILKDGGTLDDVLAFLQSDEVIRRYGLRVNVPKTTSSSADQLAGSGISLLGSWVGGPDGELSPGSALTVAAAAKLASRIELLEQLCLHDRICLLRACFYPSLNHLIRTLPPDVGVEGSKAFDQLIKTTTFRYANDPHLPTQATELLGLPKSLGGLGLCSQLLMKPPALSSRPLSSNILTRLTCPQQACGYPPL